MEHELPKILSSPQACAKRSLNPHIQNKPSHFPAQKQIVLSCRFTHLNSLQ